MLFRKFLVNFILFALGGTISMSANCDNANPITFIFPHIHYNNESWDVHNCSSLWTYFISNNIVESLIRLDENTEYEGALASAWSFSNDKKKLSFILNDNYYFHDGTKITPQIIADNIRKIADNKKTAHSDFWEDLCDDKDNSKGVELKGNILSLNFKKNINGLLFSLATPEIGIVPLSYYNEKVKIKKAIKNLSGPYKIDSFEEKQILLSANKKSPKISKTSVQKAIIEEITDFDLGIKYLKSHNNAVLIASDYSSALKLSNLSFELFSSAPALTEFFLPNMNSEKMQNLEFRKKIFSYLSKAREKIKIDSRLGMTTSQLFGPDSICRLDDKRVAKLYDNNLPRLPEPLKLKVLIFDWMKDTPIPRELAQKLQEFNIFLDFEIGLVDNYKDYIASKKHDLVYIYTGISAKDPIIEISYLLKHPITSFVTKSKNNLLEKVVSAKNEFDTEIYKNQVREIHYQMLNEYLLLPIIHTKMVYASGGKYRLKNMNHFDGGLDIWNWESNGL